MSFPMHQKSQVDLSDGDILTMEAGPEDSTRNEDLKMGK